MESKNNPFQLKLGQKILIKHIPSNSNWLPVEVVEFTDAGYPYAVGRNFSGVLDKNYETDIVIPFDDSKLGTVLMESESRKEGRLAWLERASRDETQYPSETSAFNFYWQSTH